MRNNPTKLPKTESESLVKRGSDSIGVVLATLDLYIRKAASVLDETDVERAESTATHLAQLGARVAQIVGELRKVEHHEQRGAGEITPRALSDYLRRVSPSERAQIRREMDAHERKGQSVLG